MLSELLNVHMEGFLVKKNAVPMIYDIGQCYSQATQKRFMAYYHDNRNLPGNLMLLYEQLIRIVQRVKDYDTYRMTIDLTREKGKKYDVD